MNSEGEQTILTLEERLVKLADFLKEKHEALPRTRATLKERVGLEGFQLTVDRLLEAARETGPQLQTDVANNIQRIISYRKPVGRDTAMEYMLREIIDTHAGGAVEDILLCDYLRKTGYKDEYSVPLVDTIENFCAGLKDQLKACDRPFGK